MRLLCSCNARPFHRLRLRLRLSSDQSCLGVFSPLNLDLSLGLSMRRAQCPIPSLSGLAPTNQITGDVKIHVFPHVIHAISCEFSSRILQLASLRGSLCCQTTPVNQGRSCAEEPFAAITSSPFHGLCACSSCSADALCFRATGGQDGISRGPPRNRCPTQPAHGS